MTGLYLELFHGREDPQQQMDDWGVAGPVFGPFTYVHTTYSQDIKFKYEDCETRASLSIIGGMVYYDGIYYGDWSVFSEKTLLASADLILRHQPLEAEKTSCPTIK